MRHPDRSASSTSLTPSTPTKPFSVGRPPRRAMRNSFSQRLSRLVRSAGSPEGRGLRAVLPGVAISEEGSKLLAVHGNTGSGLKKEKKRGTQKSNPSPTVGVTGIPSLVKRTVCPVVELKPKNANLRLL